MSHSTIPFFIMAAYCGYLFFFITNVGGMTAKGAWRAIKQLVFITAFGVGLLALFAPEATIFTIHKIGDTASIIIRDMAANSQP